MAEQQQQPIPVPDNFGFEWDTPEDATRFWTVDLMHWPDGLSPLAATMDIPVAMITLTVTSSARTTTERARIDPFKPQGRFQTSLSH